MAKWRVLAVDDEIEVLEIIQVTLNDEYEIVTANDSMEALERIEEIEPDLCILDIMMPKMSGYQLFDMIKKTLKFSATPVMFLSAKSSTNDVKYGYKLGAVTYLTKPFDPMRLKKNVDSLFKYTPPPHGNKKYPYAELLDHFKRSGFKQLKSASAERHDPSDQWLD